MSKIQKQKSLCFYLQTNAILFFLHHTSTFYTSRTIRDRDNVLFCGLFIYFLGEKEDWKLQTWSASWWIWNVGISSLWPAKMQKKNTTKAEYIWIKVVNTFCADSKLGIIILCSIWIKWNVADFSKTAAIAHDSRQSHETTRGVFFFRLIQLFCILQLWCHKWSNLILLSV